MDIDSYGDIKFDPYMVIRMLRKQILQLKFELAEERRRSNESVDLLMQGEALRSRMMLDAILGKFPPKVT